MRVVYALLLAGLCGTGALAPSCSSGASPKPHSVVAAGTFRYLATDKTLKTNIALSPTDTTAALTAPTLYGTVMPPLVRDQSTRQFQVYRPMEFPGNFRVTLPAGDAARHTVEFSLEPPVVDSVPRLMSRASSQNFPVAQRGLADNENLVLFFEPQDAENQVRRILVQGPTSTGNVSLPKHVLADVLPGTYDFYLIKQKLYRDSLPLLTVSLQAEYYSPTVSLEVTE